MLSANLAVAVPPTSSAEGAWQLAYAIGAVTDNACRVEITSMPDLQQLILRIHQASREPEGLQQIMCLMAHCLGGHIAAAHEDHEGSMRKGIFAHGIRETHLLDAAEDYSKRWSGENPLFEKSWLTLERDGVCASDSILSLADLKRSEYYRHFLRQLDIGYSLGVRTSPVDSGRFSVLTVNRREKRGPFSEQEINLIHLLQPHLQIALENYFAQKTAVARIDLYCSMTDASGFGQIVLDSLGKPLVMNRTAKKMLDEGAVVRIARSGYLQFTDERMQKSWTEARQGQNSGNGGLIEQVVFTRDGNPEANPARVKVAREVVASGAVILFDVVWVVTICKMPRGSAEILDGIALLTRSTGLTSREAELCLALRRYGDVPAAALALQMALSTARTHLKRVYLKMAVRRQTELMVRLDEILLDTA